jgi:hypothetical protein
MRRLRKRFSVQSPRPFVHRSQAARPFIRRCVPLEFRPGQLRRLRDQGKFFRAPGSPCRLPPLRHRHHHRASPHPALRRGPAWFPALRYLRPLFLWERHGRHRAGRRQPLSRRALRRSLERLLRAFHYERRYVPRWPDSRPRDRWCHPVPISSRDFSSNKHGPFPGKRNRLLRARACPRVPRGARFPASRSIAGPFAPASP